MKRIRLLLSLLLVLSFGYAVPLLAQTAAQTAAQAAAAPLELMSPMRDGVKLSLSVYLPEGKGPWPVVLIRTPYGKATQAIGNARWTGHGFALAVQDVRGTGKSEGKYRPFMDDHLDGYDTVEWVARQPWSNGKVGMFGASAMGIASNMAAMMAPPHLVATFVMVARSSIYSQSAFQGGVFRKELNEVWLKRMKAEWILEDMFKHAVYDGFYDLAEMPLHWHKVRVPSYNYGGWYDIFSQGNIDNFVGQQSRGSALAAGNQKLIMGPWAHGRLEEVKYPENAAVDATQEAIRWFEYWLQGKDNGIRSEPPVRYYVMGDVTDPKAPGNEWRTAWSWPVPSVPTSYFLAPGGKLGEAMPAAENASSTYKYDPKNPVPTVGGANLTILKGPMDQRAVGDRKDILKFMTEPLAEPVEITGRVLADLYAESDAPDTDFMVKLIDVYPDGTQRLVLDSAIRARFREGQHKEVFMQPGEVYQLTVDLWSTSIVFNRGHRIAVHITSSNDPRFDPNPNTGKPLRAGGETRVAANTIHHSSRYPSRILLPVVPANGKRP